MRRLASDRRRFAVLAAAVSMLGASPASARLTLDYLGIRGNEGGSAGGHAAIRFGAETFHFEHEDGLLRLKGEDSLRFQHVYRTLQNRDIELSRVPVTPETYRLLRDAFRRRALVQDRQLAIEHELEGDARLLETLLTGEPGFEVRGAGFFETASGSEAEADSAAGPLAALRRRIEEIHGAGYLAQRRAEVDLALGNLLPESLPIDAVALAADRYPVLPASFSRRSENLLAAQLALDLLAHPRPLRPQALGSQALPLEPGEQARLSELSAALRESMARLAASRREDFGFPLLLGMARLTALEASIRAQRLVVLDAFPARSRTIEITALRRSLLPGLLTEAQDDLATARGRILAGRGFREADWNALEAAAARWLELRAAEAGAPSIRVQAGRLLPEGRARVSLSALPRPAGQPWLALEQAQRTARRYRERLANLYGYDLLQRNCVSEIFRTLEAALAQNRAAGGATELHDFVREESTRRLGGYIEPVASFNFIPFVSSRRVRDLWGVTERASLPSYRHHRLAEMEASEPWLLVALRESNVLTARTYQATDGEGFFLFFTDTAGPARPLLGALNLGAGLLRSALGLAELPLDRGRALRAGLTGVLYSFPELLFQNIRKGYNDFVPPGERPPPG